MNAYEESALRELRIWQEKIVQSPSLTSRVAKNVQDKINGLIPEKAHQIITGAIRNMVKAVLFGSEFISGDPTTQGSLEERETTVRRKINNYRTIGVTTGALTGAAGFLVGLADFPVLLSLKMKLLFDMAGTYGFNVRDFQERLFILYVFQLAFSAPDRRIQTYQEILHWEENRAKLPAHVNDFDWRTFQQEYRDYIDLAKTLQLVPGIGAAVGAYANHRLVEKLGVTAMNAYRIRLFQVKMLGA